MADNGSRPEAYNWVADRQRTLMDAHGDQPDSPELAHGPDAADVGEPDMQPEAAPIGDQLPMASEACAMLARAARYADYVPDNDRKAFIGGESARIDRATLEVLEELGGMAGQAGPSPEPEPANGRPGVRAVLHAIGAHRARRGVDEQARTDAVTRTVLSRLYADEPGQAVAIVQGERTAEEATALNAPLAAAFEDDPDAAGVLFERTRFDPEQQLRLLPHEIDGELGMLRQEWATRRRVGLGLDLGQSARYAELERLRAAREFDLRGDIAERDLRALKQAALAEAIERNQPDGRVLIVTDENISTPGLIGPLLAYYGATEIHTAGVPYHQLTKDFLEGVTGSVFPDQLVYNDVTQQYEVILLQGRFPPIKPIELMIQTGARGADMGIIPGEVNQRFVDELESLIHDEQSVYYGQYQLVERPSELVAISPLADGQTAAANLKQYMRPTLLLLRGQPDDSSGYVFSSMFAEAA